MTAFHKYCCITECLVARQCDYVSVTIVVVTGQMVIEWVSC